MVALVTPGEDDRPLAKHVTTEAKRRLSLGAGTTEKIASANSKCEAKRIDQETVLGPATRRGMPIKTAEFLIKGGGNDRDERQRCLAGSGGVKTRLLVGGAAQASAPFVESDRCRELDPAEGFRVPTRDNVKPLVPIPSEERKPERHPAMTVQMPTKIRPPPKTSPRQNVTPDNDSRR